MVDLAQAFGQRSDLLQHRFDLLLVVGRLNHIDGHHQKTSRSDRGLRIVALLEAAPAAGMMRDASSVRLT